MRLIYFISALLCFSSFSYSQEQPVFSPPMKIPLFLSGNFGEIRPDHPHSGIDIKTQGVTGMKVYAASEGYISRIKVQAGGYGYSLYIDHPNGYTTQYGHLSSYRSDIDEYVKNIQYGQQSFTVDIYPPKEQFRVERGEFIALSGNSGSSGGPHLHFEVRTTANQHPVNVLKYQLPITDNIAPKFFNLVIYPVDNASQVEGARNKLILPVVLSGKEYRVKNDGIIGVSGRIGFGTEVFDFLDGSNNRCGVYTLELLLDGERRFMLNMDEFSFAESRYINAHADYEEIVSRNKKIHRMYRLPNDRFSVYSDLINNGVIDLNDSLIHTISVRATDVAGNRSELSFRIRRAAFMPTVAGMDEHSLRQLDWEKANEISDSDLVVSLPARCLYDDVLLPYKREPSSYGSYADWFSIGTPEIPLHLACTLKIAAPNIENALLDKALIVKKDSKNKITAVGGKAEGKYIVSKCSEFGCFSVALDTLAPVIKALNIQAGKNMEREKDIRFNISDDLSGIASYRGYIDSKWVLFSYDAKNNLLLYSFDPARLTKGGLHELELYVTDNKGNTSLYHSSFNW